MAEETNGAAPAAGGSAAAAADPDAVRARHVVREHRRAEGARLGGAKPDVRVQVNIDAQQRAADHYEVALKVKVNSKIGEAPVFILELDYAGIFVIQNVPQEQMHPLLMIECPRLIFPYVRRIVSDLTRDGGYPPMNLEQVDFLSLYRSELARRGGEGAGAGLTADPTDQAELGPEGRRSQLGHEGGMGGGLGGGEARRRAGAGGAGRARCRRRAFRWRRRSGSGPAGGRRSARDRPRPGAR